MNTMQSVLPFDDLSDPNTLDSSDLSDGWYTPAWVVEKARMVCPIDLDPASCSAAQAIVQARSFYTKHEDGLSQPWYGNVWLNPPYSDPFPWCHRMVTLYQSNDIRSGMVLVNCSCSSKWAQLIWRHADAVCLFNRRINWWHPSKLNANGSYDRDSILAYFGTERHLFEKVFSDQGVIR